MLKTIFQIDGMRCSMCEMHVNDIIRKTTTAKKITSNHKKNIAEVISLNQINEEEISKALLDMGYRVLNIQHVNVTKTLFGYKEIK